MCNLGVQYNPSFIMSTVGDEYLENILKEVSIIDRVIDNKEVVLLGKYVQIG